MIGRELALALEDDWRETLDAIAARRRWPTSRDTKRLAADVATLSAAYNDSGNAPAGEGPEAGAVAAKPMAARLLFSFPRDVPKGAGAVRELVATGALAMPSGRPLRVLDIGAGLGATTWGLARALEARGGPVAIEATWLDADAVALEIGVQIAQARRGSVSARAVRFDVGRRDARVPVDARADVVLLGQVLSELDRWLDDGERAQKHAAMIRDLADRALEPDGSLVVIEPALRDRTRHLHRVRDALLASPDRALGVFAPCLHAAPCPALAREGDWCHEDLAVDLPDWLVPIARAAGLRYQGLTYSYVVLRKDGVTLASSRATSASAARLRVVSDPIATKGKRELFLCGSLGGAGVRVRAMRLDRDARASNEAWGDAVRGDVLDIDPAPDPGRPRVDGSSTVTRA